MSQHFEANIYGLIYYALPLEVEEKAIRLVQIVLPLGRIVRLAAVLLRETTTNLFLRVQLEGVAGYHIVPTDSRDVVAVRPGRYSAIEDFIAAETDALRETLDDLLIFGDHIVELIRQLLWAFDWAETQRIRARTEEILHANGMR